MGFDPCNRLLKIRESIGTPTPNVGIPLGVRGFFPSHSFALPGAWNATPRLSFGLHPCKSLPWSRAQGLGYDKSTFFFIMLEWNHKIHCWIVLEDGAYYAFQLLDPKMECIMTSPCMIIYNFLVLKIKANPLVFAHFSIVGDFWILWSFASHQPSYPTFVW